MKDKSTLITLFLLTFSFVLIAQEAIQFAPKDLQNISKRWSKYHPEAEVLLHNGDTIAGQPIYFDMHELVLFSSDSLPINLEGLLVSIPFADIDQVKLDRGGPVTPGLAPGIIIGIGVGLGIGAALAAPVGALLLGNALGGLGGIAGKALFVSSTTAELELDPQNSAYRKEITKLHEWSVFEDSLIYTNEISLLPVYSGAMRRLYPQKHFRITLGMNFGLNSLEKDMQEAISASGFPAWDYYSHRSLGFEFIDLSWRFSSHWILGGGIMANTSYMASADYYSGYDTGSEILNYSYSVDLLDYRIYTEYVISPVNRFLTERTEFLVGGGAIISRPKANYSGYYEKDPSTGETEHFYVYGPNTIFGFQARAAAHLYLFRNFSLSGGLELNLYQNLNMPAMEAPSGESVNPPVFEAHTLNYSTLRFKLGAHLYF